MTTAFDQIVDNIATLLGGAPAVCTTITTDQVDEFAEDITQAVEIDLGDSAASELGGIHGNPLDWRTPVRIVCHAKATTGASARQAVNALVASVNTRLDANRTLGMGDGVHVQAEFTINWSAQRKAHHMAAAEMGITVTHRTTTTALT